MELSVKDFIISLFSAIISGIILLLIEKTFINIFQIYVILIVSVLIGICSYLFIFVYRVKSLGISKILTSSVKGEGATLSYMKKASHSISFVGIAASKWIEHSDELEETIRRICASNTGYIHFLLLNPSSQAADKLNIANPNQATNSVKQKIEKSLDVLKKIADNISKDSPNLLKGFEVRLYNAMPIYRLAILDNSKAYLCFYKIGCDGSKLKQFAIKTPNSTENSQNIFNSMTEYFETLWEANDTIKFDVF